jgi:TetR/AcrR family transcriptional regulator, transcriptional repressor for nem operon
MTIVRRTERAAMSPKAEQKSRTRAAILASAARLLRDRGIVGARVADVMEGAGLTVGGFYAHFPSKEALVDETLTRTAEAMRDRLFSRLDDKPEADRAEIVLKRYLAAAHRDETEIGCPFPAVAGEIATTAPEHAPALASQLEAMSDALRPLLPERAGISARHLALGLSALMIGGLTLARATRGTETSDELLRACRALGRVALGRAG